MNPEVLATNVKKGRATSFEAVNATLKEIFVGVFAAPADLDEIRERHRLLPPRSIRHWRPDHEISYRVLAEDLSGEDALAFLKCYVPTVRDRVWAVFTE
ncbi:MAG: hypothetical protein PHU21_00825 [Elusimicrobia bacterium]|nr:hypothetical protein [Elusimicrobiota bacterium]